MLRTVLGPLSAAFLAAGGLAGCDTAAGDGPSEAPDLGEVLHGIGADVIFATYVEFAARADSLKSAVDRLAAAPDAARLEAARQAWRDSRAPWESGEGFLFGPVVTLPIDAPIDSWPVNQVDLGAVLASDVPLTKPYLDSLDVNLKGFHTVEYLLFGDSAAPRTPEGLAGRPMAYLQAATASLAGEVHRLKDAWDPAHGDFLGTLEKAGRGSTVYESREQALREILFAMSTICDEVANEKIFNVIRFDPPDRIQEESRFSDNSTADFANNIRSARNVYLGSYRGGAGKGIKALLDARDPALAAKLAMLFESAIAKTEAMGVFGNTLFADRGRIESASEAIRTLRAALIVEVAPALGVEF